MAVCSVPYTLLTLWLVMGLQENIFKLEAAFLVKIIGYSLLVFYYLISIYIHFLYDKEKSFKKLFVFSFRLWVFVFLVWVLSLFLFDSQLLGGDSSHIFVKAINPFTLFPITSVFFTWWISELVVRWMQKYRPDLLEISTNHCPVRMSATRI